MLLLNWDVGGVEVGSFAVAGFFYELFEVWWVGLDCIDPLV